MKISQCRSFSEALVAFQKQEGFSTGDLAQRLGVTRQAVWYWETNRRKPRPGVMADLIKLGFNPAPDISSILRWVKEQLATALGVEPDDILILVEGLAQL